jgi:mannose-1-phosphate guanylyltransferase
LRDLTEVKALLLAAGLGTRLKPLTEEWPKCLMPIGKRPLLEYWFDIFHTLKISSVLVNISHHHKILREYISRPRFKNWVEYVYEKNLLGTAGTLRRNSQYFQNSTTLLVHSDNWCQCNFSDFLEYHFKKRPKNCPITMMTFESQTPETCGIVEVNSENIVVAFHEKIINPPGNIANGAVYLIEPEVVHWLDDHPCVTDFSTELLPNFLGGIATWHNRGIHRDIGTLPMLIKAQFDPQPDSCWPQTDIWQEKFIHHPIHYKIAQSSK